MSVIVFDPSIEFPSSWKLPCVALGETFQCDCKQFDPDLDLFPWVTTRPRWWAHTEKVIAAPGGPLFAVLRSVWRLY